LLQSLRNSDILIPCESLEGDAMHKAAEYRGIAAKLRREAMATPLPQKRKLNLGAAERWEILAAEIEVVTAPAAAGLSPQDCWVN
jgi:hypothetical protein